MSDKKKLDDNTSENNNYRDEMDELVRIFKEELGKAQEEAEENEEIEDIDDFSSNLEVEGYDPKSVSRDNQRKKTVDFDTYCECCGERPRGTKKNPNSIFCEECEAILEKYPYDWRGIITIVAVLAIVIFGLVNFAADTPAFSHMIKGDKYFKEKKLYSAISEYDYALVSIDDELRESYKNLFAKRALVGYEALDKETVRICLSYFEENELKSLRFKEIKKISEELNAEYATREIISRRLYEIKDDDYEGIIEVLDSLSGKKIYEKNGVYYDELDTSYKPDGTEKTYVCDEGWLYVYKYLAARVNEKEDKVMIEFLENAMGKSDYIDRAFSRMLASAYVDSGDYEKAETLAKKMKQTNVEGIDYELIMSMIYRYRDKNYQRAVDTSLEALEHLATLDDAYNLVGGVGYTLSMQKTLNFIMMGKYDDAFESAEECCQYQMDSLGEVDSLSRDLYAILALATKNDAIYEELETDIKESGTSGLPFSQDVTDYKEGKITLEEIVMSGRYDIL